MVEIIPAIMPKSLEDLREKHLLVRDLVPLVQIDVMDGRFVPSVSWPHNERFVGPLPRIDFDFEADLMVENPEVIIRDWISAGAKRVIVHIESVKNFSEIFDATVGKTELGIALDAKTPNDAIYPFIDKISFVQFMGIEKIGFQGQDFDESVLQKIADLRRGNPDIIISVDGGVSLENAPRLVRAGANRLVSGSAIFKSDNVKEVINRLANIE
jgi:ribulose-phosphate 3-epimerase